VTAFLRLRQVCLVAADLGPAATKLQAVLGLQPCYRDPNVGKYGLENVLFPVGSSFLEIVSPVKPGTAAGRFLERHGGRNGYMIILDCDDPERWQQRAGSLGIRTANTIRHDAYLGVQLHPKDTGAAMVEFNRTRGGDDPMGAYAPAGPDWQRAIRTDNARRLIAVEIEAPDPRQLSARWSELLDRTAARRDGSYEIALDAGAIRFLPANTREAAFTTVEIGAVRPGLHELCGVRFRLVDA
jgi:hypothetical protein